MIIKEVNASVDNREEFDEIFTQFISPEWNNKVDREAAREHTFNFLFIKHDTIVRKMLAASTSTGELMGCMIFHYYTKIDCTLIAFVNVGHSFRYQNIASSLLTKSIELCEELAETYSNKRIHSIFSICRRPSIVEKGLTDLLSFFSKRHFTLIRLETSIPRLYANTKEETVLVVRQYTHLNLLNIPKESVSSFVELYLVYEVPEPMEIVEDIYTNFENEIAKKDTIPVGAIKLETCLGDIK